MVIGSLVPEFCCKKYTRCCHLLLAPPASLKIQQNTANAIFQQYYCIQNKQQHYLIAAVSLHQHSRREGPKSWQQACCGPGPGKNILDSFDPLGQIKNSHLKLKSSINHMPHSHHLALGIPHHLGPQLSSWGLPKQMPHTAMLQQQDGKQRSRKSLCSVKGYRQNDASWED